MTVGDLLTRMTSDEITEWKALLFIEHEERQKRDAARRAESELSKIEGKMKGRR